MPIPPLNKYGLLDEGIYECTMEQIATQFVSTETRKTLWNNFCTFLERANQQRLFCAVYLDGSFVSNKPEPQDIDIVLEFCSAPFPDDIDWSELQKNCVTTCGNQNDVLSGCFCCTTDTKRQ